MQLQDPCHTAIGFWTKQPKNEGKSFPPTPHISLTMCTSTNLPRNRAFSPIIHALSSQLPVAFTTNHPVSIHARFSKSVRSLNDAAAGSVIEGKLKKQNKVSTHARTQTHAQTKAEDTHTHTRTHTVWSVADPLFLDKQSVSKLRTGETSHK